MRREKPFIVDILFVLAVFGVFTVCALVLVTIGSEIYRHTVDEMSRNYETRTAIAYIAEKIRQNDGLLSDSSADVNNKISISTLEGIPALQITQEVNGDNYLTYLYLHNGFLKELYIRSDTDLGGNILAAGQDIIKLSDFRMTQINDNLLEIELITHSGKTHRMYASLHCSP